MGITDDPIRDAYLFDMDEEERINRLPVCPLCGEHIQDEELILWDDVTYHENCLTDDFYKRIEEGRCKTRHFIKEAV